MTMTTRTHNAHEKNEEDETARRDATTKNVEEDTRPFESKNDKERKSKHDRLRRRTTTSPAIKKTRTTQNDDEGAVAEHEYEDDDEGEPDDAPRRTRRRRR